MTKNTAVKKNKSLFKLYILGSGILLNIFFLSMLFYGVYKVSQLGVSFEDVVNKTADKIYPKAPMLANFLKKATEETNDDWMFDDVNVEEWSGKGASIAEQKNVKGKGPLIEVFNSQEFLAALNNVEAGSVVKLMPGTYKIKKRSIRLKNSGTSLMPIVVQGDLTQVTLELDTLEGFYVDKPFWIFENLKLKGACASDSQCEHAFHVVGNGAGVIIRNNIVVDFNSAIKVNGVKVDGRYAYPDNGKITNNTFLNHTIRDTDNPVTVLDIIAVNDWVVSDNLIADFIKGKGNRVSYAAFFKGNGARNTFEKNLVICRMNLKPQGGAQVGLSFGGGGTGQSVCRGQQCPVEHSSGIIRHNLVVNCNDVAIYLNKSKDTEIYNNTLINTLGIDVRFPESSATIANNFLTGRIKDRNGGRSQSMNNLVVSLADVKDYYKNPMQGDFTLQARDDMVDQGVSLQMVEEDFCGKKRGPDKMDIGAFEYAKGASTCNPFFNE